MPRATLTDKDGRALCMAYRGGRRCRRLATVEAEWTDQRGVYRHAALCQRCAAWMDVTWLEESDRGFKVRTVSNACGVYRVYTPIREAALQESGALSGEGALSSSGECPGGLPADPEARALFVQAERRDPRFICNLCGRWYQGRSCPTCGTRDRRLVYPDLFEWDAALLAYIQPHEHCETAKSGRPCSADCGICEWSGHDHVIDLGGQGESDGVPF